MIEIGRRSVLRGLGALLCAPAIVRASSLMPVKALRPVDIDALLRARMEDATQVMARQMAERLFNTGYVSCPPGWPFDPVIVEFNKLRAYTPFQVEL